ncbi:MAG: ABC transporter substrate-binding protein [Butyrivibrio sp.]|nr:ABC transporter substrate-binding protein [Acetatifactor muris]MCM1560514.1 ABC transporter substrate-binding protein [Butyrivibrio sp.]
MRKKLLCCILVAALGFQCCSCGKSNTETVGDGGGTGEENQESSEKNDIPAGNTDFAGEDLFLSLEDMPWRDNSLDAYAAVINMPLQYTKQEGTIDGGISAYILGDTRASVFKKHLFEEPSECWDEIKTVTAQDTETSFHLDFKEGQLNQAWMAGGIAGSDHYIMMGEVERDDARGYLYPFYETDENMQIVNTFYADCLAGDDFVTPSQLQADAEGNLHMIINRYSGDISTYHYYIAAPDGTLLAEVGPREGFTPEERPELFLLYDGRVGMRLGEELKCADIETGDTEVLVNIKSGWRSCALQDEKTLVYADTVGVYRSGLSGENPELLYTWSNHGVFASKIEAMQVTGNGSISLIYTDYKGANYLRLEPVTEEVEIRDITFAVSSSQKYQSAVAAFNKKYPAYRIRLKTYSLNDTNLQTELIAGKGPVLVDTALVNFENNAEWWEPLDEVFRQMKLDEELIPKVLDTGKIDGTLYGVVTDFHINTVVTFAEEPEEWDYDTFLDCFDENDISSMKSVFLPFSGSDGYSFIAAFFYHTLKEKYLFDAEHCTTRFDSEEFRKILRLAEYFMDRDHQADSEDFRQGASLCAAVSVYKPEDMACLRIWGGNKLKFIGYPSEDGSVHYIEGSSPITVRANATVEEKQLAHSFIRFLLSYEAQMESVLDVTNFDYAMSARKDVLEEQINRMDEYTYTTLSGFPQFELGKQVNRELDGAALYELLEKTEPKHYMPRELVWIFAEELDAYLSGNLTEDMLIEHLENRVGLYLSEQK